MTRAKSCLLVMAGLFFGLATGLGFGQANPGYGSAGRPSNVQPQLQERNPRYVIQRSDVLELSFTRTPEFNQTVTVQPDGYISLQNARTLHVQGMTVQELIAALKVAYADSLHEPIINVDLVDFQKPFFSVVLA